MIYDIIITDIISVFYRENFSWHRDQMRPRCYDGIVLFTEGEIEYRFENHSLFAKAGDILILPQGIAYSGKMLSQTASYYVVDFLCHEKESNSQFITPAVFQSRNYQHNLGEFAHALTLWQNQEATANFKTKALLFSLMADYALQKIQQPDRRTNEILLYISRHFSDASLNVKFLCKKFFISEAQLRRNMSKAIKESPNEYILTLRINKAKQELSYTDKAISQIAADCGFSSSDYFSKCFSGRMGISPLQYRKKNHE